MDIELTEVREFGLFSMFIGIGIFVLACAYDPIVGVQVHHNEGYGWMQILVIACSGFYSMWAWSIHLKWKKYIKQIHRFKS